VPRRLMVGQVRRRCLTRRRSHRMNQWVPFMKRGRQVCHIAPRTILIVAAALISVLPGIAQSISTSREKARELDTLFEKLEVASDEYEADKIADKISELWSKSGRPEIDEQFLRVSFLMTELKFAAALHVLDEVVQRAPDWVEGWNTRATVHYLVGALDRALADTERALALEARHFHALRTMGASHERKGQYREALAAYRKALALHPFLNDRLDVIPELERKLGDKPH
jgi:tetratricopeptide (TPR) repeat protein